MHLSTSLRLLAPIGFLTAAVLTLYACSSSEDRAKSYYDRGVELAAKGDPVKASLEFRNALRLKPQFKEAQFGLGQAFEQQGDYAGAVKLYLAVSEQDAANVPARVRLSYIFLAAGQVDGAKKYVDQASALAPDDASVLVTRAAIALKQGDKQGAIDLANAALAKQPQYPDALVVLASERLLGSDPAGALKFLDHVVEVGDRDMGIQMLRLTALEAMGDAPGVEQLFNKLIALLPQNAALRGGLVKWYLSKGRKDDAESAVRKFVADNPGDQNAEMTLVSFLNSERSSDAAVAELETVLKARGNGQEAFVFRQALGQLKYTTGAKDEAIKLIQTLVDDTTETTAKNEARIQLAGMLASDGHVDQTMTLVQTVLAEDPRNVDALALRGSLYLDRNSLEDASQDLLAALNEAPDNARLHSLLADAYERSGSVALAQEQYSKAADLDQYSPATGVPMAQFFARYGKFDQAIRVLENVRRVAPNDRNVLGKLADMKLAMQDWTGAQEIADALRTLNNGNDTTADRIGAAALGGLSRFTESIGLLQTALNDNPDAQDQVLPDLIGAYVRSGKPEVAEEYLKTLLQNEPDNTTARIFLGSVRLVQGKTDSAEADFKLAADNMADLRGEVALADFYWKTDKLLAAEKAVTDGLQQQPDSVPLLTMLAKIYERNERFDDAIAQYEKLLAVNPRSTQTANDLASLLSERRSDPASLQRAFEIAQRLSDSEIPEYLDTLGWIHHLRGDAPLALPLLKKAAERRPDIGLLQYHLGVVLAELGQKDAAKSALHKALVAKQALFDVDRKRVTEALAQLDQPEVEQTNKTAS